MPEQAGTEIITLDYQVFIFEQNLITLIISMFHSVRGVPRAKMERFAKKTNRPSKLRRLPSASKSLSLITKLQKTSP